MAFVFLATILTGVMIAIYVIFNLSCMLFYLRRQRSEFNILLHAVIPVLGIIAFIPAFLTALGLGSSFLKFVTPLTYPSSETGLAIGIWFVIGIVVLVYLAVRHPARLPEMKRVFADEPVPAAARRWDRHDGRGGLRRVQHDERPQRVHRHRHPEDVGHHAPPGRDPGPHPGRRRQLRRMHARLSQGHGHPEFVPIRGSKAYPQRSGRGAADGTGDFDSASRGGPARER